MEIIKSFSDGTYLEYAQGGFDGWCVYIVAQDGQRIPPHDKDYFGFLQHISTSYGADRVYSDFVKVYNRTGKIVENEVFDFISNIATTYDAQQLQIEKTLSILYMTMISEENRRNTRLGKRIKRLGIHKLLIEGASVSDSANFMRDMGWREIAALCKQRGF